MFNLEDSNFDINYSHNESIGKPLYLPGTDVLISEAAEKGTVRAQDLQTMNISDTWTASNIKIKIPTGFWLIRDTFNALSFGFNYNKTFSRSPTVLSNKTWIWNAAVNYGINLSPDYYFRPADIPVIGSIISLFTDYRNAKINFTPQNFAFNINAKRNRAVNVTRERITGSQGTNLSQSLISRDFTTQEDLIFPGGLQRGAC